MLERGLLARLYSPLILVTRQDFKNLGWSRYITGTNIRIISLSLNLLPVEKKIKKKEKTENPFLWWRGVFSFQFHRKARDSYFSCRRFIRNDPLIDPLQSLSHREYSECSKRSLDTSSSVGNWKRSTCLFLLLVRFPRCSTRERKLLRNLRIDGDARVSFITLHARPDRDEKLRALSPPL